MTIPESVSSIGPYAFSYCTSLSSLIFQGKYTGEISTMANYSWGITDTSIIRGELDAKTVFTFSDGTRNIHDFSGKLTLEDLKTNGYKTNFETWVSGMMPVDIKLGT